MYGCRRSPNRKLNHTNLICGRGNQITCFGCSADDEFIFVTKLSRQRKGGGGDRVYMCTVLGNGEKKLAGICHQYCYMLYVVLSTVWWPPLDVNLLPVKSMTFHLMSFTSSTMKCGLFYSSHRTATNVSSLQMLGLPSGVVWRKSVRKCRHLLYVFISTAAEQLDMSASRPKASYG